MVFPLYIVFALLHVTQTERSCPSNTTDCFGTCCPDSRKCCYDYHTTVPKGGKCCPIDTPNCWNNPADDPYGEFECYADDQEPCWNRELYSSFCNKTLGQTCCADLGRDMIPVACCNSGDSCCIASKKSECCSPGFTCCNHGDGCCPPGSTCCANDFTNECCPEGTTCYSTGQGCCPLKSVCMRNFSCCYGTSKPLCLPGGYYCYNPDIEFPCLNHQIPSLSIACLLNETCCNQNASMSPTCLPPGQKCCPECPACLAGMCLLNTTTGITCTYDCYGVDVEKDSIIWELESRRERIRQT